MRTFVVGLSAVCTCVWELCVMCMCVGGPMRCVYVCIELVYCVYVYMGPVRCVYVRVGPVRCVRIVVPVPYVCVCAGPTRCVYVCAFLVQLDLGSCIFDSEYTF